MSAIWVDTDFGFDDLWALLLLRHLGCEVAGVSLVAGNAPLPQVAANAVAAKAAYRFDWPLWRGAAQPLKRAQETAERVLGPTGMQSRGARLPTGRMEPPPKGAREALDAWLCKAGPQGGQVLALGPLTNIATLLRSNPGARDQISRLVWMGGSGGPGNHTAKAEFNAVADPEAAAQVLGSGVRVDVVDLSFCRQVTFGPEDMPESDPLTADLLGGYLDIALSRARAGMAIYDPVAALALAKPESIAFTPCQVSVSTTPDARYGATRFDPEARSVVRLATAARLDLAQCCLGALTKEALCGQGS